MLNILKNSDEYYLGAQYIIVEMQEEKNWDKEIIKTIFSYGILFLLFMLIVGYFLLKAFLRPLKDALYLLDRFIKDTTHELNTPVSTILTNIELIRETQNEKLLQKALARIEIGAKTLSNIYDDLTFLILKHKLTTFTEQINLNSLVDERIEYFNTLLQMKNITVKKEFIDEVVIDIDRKKIIKVVDNLLSNAIKYNKLNGEITIKIIHNSLSIKDSGIGIEQKNLHDLFTRYSRFTTTTGGFGIGLHIVKSIVDEYGFTVRVESKEDEFTEFTILF